MQFSVEVFSTTVPTAMQCASLAITIPAPGFVGIFGSRADNGEQIGMLAYGDGGSPCSVVGSENPIFANRRFEFLYAAVSYCVVNLADQIRLQAEPSASY